MKKSGSKKKNTRKFLLQVHLWLGLTVGSILAVVGLTGAIYVFAPEIESYSRNQRIKQDEHLPLLLPVEVVKKLESRTGKKLLSFSPQRRAEKAYLVTFYEDKGLSYFVNPYTAEILEKRKKKTFFYWVIQIHMNLTLGKAGQWITGISSLLLCFVLIVTGIYLWWPKSVNKNSIRQRFTIRWKARWRRVNYDLHNVGGFYLHLIIWFLAFTGAYFTFPVLVTALVTLVTLSPLPEKFDWSNIKSSYYEGAEELSFIQALNRADKIVPEHKLLGLNYPEGQDKPIRVTKHNIDKIQAGPYIRTYSYLDRYTGELIVTYDPRNLPLGSKILGLYQRQIHYGEIGGLTTRILAMIGSLFLPVLYITGIYIWWGRRKKKKKTDPASRNKRQEALRQPIPG